MTAQCGCCQQNIPVDTLVVLVPSRIKSVPHIDASVDPFRVVWEVRVLAVSQVPGLFPRGTRSGPMGSAVVPPLRT